MTVYSSVTELIGHTPLVKLDRIAGSSATVITKPKFYNPVNSVKGHIDATIIGAAEASDELKPSGTIVEGTPGNTGIALAMVGATKGYKVVLAMLRTTSLKRRALLRTYGAKLVLTPGPLGMKGAVAKAEEIAGERGGVLARQFANPVDLAVHRHTTAEEIWADTDDKVDIFVTRVGAGDTVSRIGRVLEEHKPKVRIIAIEPVKSPILSDGQSGPHKIQGLEANFVPEILSRNVINEIITRNIDQSTGFARAAATQEDLLVGISPGVTLSATAEVADRPENADETIVAVLPDFDERCLSTILLEGLVGA